MMLSLTINVFAQDAKKIHNKAILVDTHGDILFNQIESGIDVGKLQSKGNFDLVRAKQGGLDVQVFSVWSDEKGDFNLANRQIDSLNSLIKRYPEKIALVKTAIALETAVKQKKLAAMIGVEGGHMIDNDLSKLEELAKRGMIYLTLTWNNNTSWASSAAEETKGNVVKPGLNDFGKSVVRKLNELGVMVDLSHVGERTFFDALKVTTKPVLVSHSCAYAINPVPRNLKDEQIKAIGENGGVISINFYSGFLDPSYSNRQKEFIAKHKVEFDALAVKHGRSNAVDMLVLRHRKEADSLRPSIDMVVDHIDHVVKLIGIDHVGIGADFDGAESFPAGMDSVADFPKVTAALVKRGYKEEDIYKILGGNFIRVLKANKGE